MLDKVQLICLSLPSAPHSWTRHRRCSDGVGRHSVQGREDHEHWWMPAVSHGIPAQQFASCATPGMVISHLFAELECGIGNYKYTLHFYGNSVRRSLSRHTSVRYTYMTVLHTGGMSTCQLACLKNTHHYPNSKNETIRLEENIMALLFFLDKLEGNGHIWK